MQNADWLKRLICAVEEDPRTFQAISLAAGLGQNYVSQMVKRRTMPTTNAVLQLCRVLGKSPNYIFTGADIDADASEFLRLFIFSVPGS